MFECFVTTVLVAHGCNPMIVFPITSRSRNAEAKCHDVQGHQVPAYQQQHATSSEWWYWVLAADASVDDPGAAPDRVGDASQG